jgi:hypothetical protein
MRAVRFDALSAPASTIGLAASVSGGPAWRVCLQRSFRIFCDSKQGAGIIP